MRCRHAYFPEMLVICLDPFSLGCFVAQSWQERWGSQACALSPQLIRAVDQCDRFMAAWVHRSKNRHVARAAASALLALRQLSNFVQAHSAYKEAVRLILLRETATPGRGRHGIGSRKWTI
jgi:hypothetical protein